MLYSLFYVQFAKSVVKFDQWEKSPQLVIANHQTFTILDFAE